MDRPAIGARDAPGDARGRAGTSGVGCGNDTSLGVGCGNDTSLGILRSTIFRVLRGGAPEPELVILGPA